MNSSIITNSKNSNAPQSKWQDDGRVNLLLFPSEENFKLFLKSLGVPQSLLNSSRKDVVGTYGNLVGYIILFANINNFTTTYSNGVKKGNSTTFKFGPGPEYLVVFNNISWYMYVRGTINSGTNYTVTTLPATSPNGVPSGTILPS